MNECKITLEKIIEKYKLETKIAVPFRSHQLHYEESQNLFGLTKSLNFYNNSTNDQFNIKCVLNNNFYFKSHLLAKIKKTSLTESGLSFEEYETNLFEVTCEEANEDFEALKKEFYDPHIKITVPPRQ